MRRVMHGDVVAAARVLLALPEAGWPGMCQRLFQEAHWADRWTRRLGRVHPCWGNGSLMAAALNHCPGPEPGFGDSSYCSAFECVLRELVSWRCAADRISRRRRKCRSEPPD